MLKGIPAILSPELLKVVCEMGHGDELVIADGNFPAESIGKNAIVIRADGHGVPEMLDAILQIIPLDQYVDQPAALMKVVPGDSVVPVIWDEYRALLKKHGEDPDKVEMMERFAFYDRAKNAYAVIATGETAIYANVLLKKGVVKRNACWRLISAPPAGAPSSRSTTAARSPTKRCTASRTARANPKGISAGISAT